MDGNHVFIEYKSGTYISCDPPGSGKPYPCGPDAWNNEIWNEQAYVWQNGSLVQTWNFQSDWKPEPNTDVGGQNQDGLGGWEPVFHPVLWNGYLFVPGFGGTIYKVDEATGAEVAQYNPNGSTINANSYVSGPLMSRPSSLRRAAAGHHWFHLSPMRPPSGVRCRYADFRMVNRSG